MASDFLCKACLAERNAASHQRHRDARLASMREYGKRPEVREKQNARARTPEAKAKARENYHRPEVAARRRDSYLMKRYGITQADYDAMLADQGGACAICRSTDPGTSRGNGDRFHVDHCHESNVVRGLLCSACNTALGTFGDDEARLLAAADYLRLSRAVATVAP